MKNLASLLSVCGAALSLGAGGCVSASIAEDGDVAEVSQADEANNGLTENGLTMNGLTMNGLTMNGLTMNGLTMNGLTMNGLTMNGLTMNGLTMNSLISGSLTDAASRTVMRYVIGCALPDGVTVNAEIPAGSGVFYSFPGQVGLYPDWSTGVCPADTCQSWVSACVIARINAVGHVVPLSIRGADLSADAQERSLYPRPDAVFFGDIFASPQIRYACTPSNGALTRTCGQGVDPSACTAVQYLGPCSSFCDTQAADGSFQGCWNTAAPHTGGTAYPASISVFLQADQVVP